MSPSIFARAAAAATLLASTASAAYSAGSGNNVAVYWGQGNAQKDLTSVCNDPSYDVVNIAFVSGFPKKRGDYPTTNFGNACGSQWFKHPTDPTQDQNLLSSCPGIAPGIAACRANGKKVLLSLGGGWPLDYYLPSEDIADYFAEFLAKAFGPKQASWTGPRPFGDAYVDGFDLDLEADETQVPSKEYISANYAYFVNRLKFYQSGALISAAPQCQVPDARLADAIKGAPFDMIFVQFYNTYECSALKGYQEMVAGSGNEFTFNQWAEWLIKNSKNPSVKLYMGLPAGTDGLSTHKDHYLDPKQTYSLVSKWKAAYESIFGGIMLWEAKVSSDNVVNGKSFGYWSKAILDKRFTKEYNSYVSTSIVSTSTAKATSSSKIASSTKVASTTASSKVVSSSASSKVISSTASSKAVSSSASSKVVSSTASSKVVSSSVSSKAVSSSASSTFVSSSASATPSKSASSSAAVSSSIHASSTVVSSSVHASSTVVSSSVHASSSIASSSVHASSSAASSSAVVSSSSASVHASSTESAHVSSSADVPSASSSVYNVPSASTPYPTGNMTYTPYPTGSLSSSATPSIVYPQDTTKSVYPHSSSDLVYPSSSSSVHYEGNATTPCTTSTKVPSSTPIYGASTTPGYPVYGASSSSTPGAPVYGASSSSGKGHDSYPVSSTAKGYGGEYPPSVTSLPGKDVPYVPASSTVKTITTTYVDSCETGITTKTETITQTVCNKCQGDSVTSVYVCNKCGPSVVTITITKPNTPATNVPSYPTPPAKPEGPTYGGDKPQEPAKPSTPSMGGDKPSNPPTYGGDKPQPPAQPSMPAKPSSPVYGADVPKKQEAPASTTVAIVYVTKTPVPVVPSIKNTPIPYPSAPGGGYPNKPVVGTGVPSMPSGTGVPTKPTGTGIPTKPTYAPPQFTGAASHVGVGMTGFLAVIAWLLVL